MAADELVSPERLAGAGGAARLALQAAQRQFWVGLAATAVAWGRGGLACLAGAALTAGALSAFPVLLWWGVPFTVPVSAVVIAWVGLRCAPQWGSVFAAFMGLMADASGPALPGATAWAYVPVAVCFTLLHRHLRREHPATLLLYATAQALVQTTGTYVGLRLAGLTSTPGHVAGATVFLSVLLTALGAGGVALAVRLVRAVSRHFRRAV